MSEGLIAVKKRWTSSLLVLMLVFVSFNSAAADTDGDGIDDSLDDCPVAEGNSTVDRIGCPDKDGDGTSDKNDPWAISNGGFLEDARQASNDDFYITIFGRDGQQYLTSDGSTMRVWDTATKQNLRSVSISGISDVAWSPNGTFVAVSTNSDELKTYYSNNMTLLFSVGTGGEDTNELEYSSDGTMIAVVGARDGNNGDGQVEIFDSMNGTLIRSFEPAGEDQFYSVDWSPDGSRIVIGGDEDIWVYETETWTQNATRNTNRGSINAIAWSPDGNSIAVCEAYTGGGARVRMIDYHSMDERWVYDTSTSCNSVVFSPDSTQVAAGHTYYQSDGASIRIFKTHDTTATIIDTLAAPRPGGCTSSGNGNNCGSIYGVDWHPNGMYIISAHGRNDEGIYHWTVNPDIDNDGVLNQDDAFPEDGTQWNDTDNDGFGDNPLPASQGDSCLTVPGTSWQDRFGCPDDDGDGYSNDGDDFPNDVTQWADSDSDGYGDNYYFEYLPGNGLHHNQTGDALPMNPTQWNDTDGDGWGDNFDNISWLTIRPTNWPGNFDESATQVDAFPHDSTQWLDSDGDWFGDESAPANSPDWCPSLWGNSTEDRGGCYDEDGDGWSNPTAGWPALFNLDCEDGADAFPTDVTQWCDGDGGDGYGDNADGNNADVCPGEFGTSFQDRLGCADSDNDGWSNAYDRFPNDPTQWNDSDADGQNLTAEISSCGDNPDGNNPDWDSEDSSQCSDRDGDGYGDRDVPGGDAFPDEPTQWLDSDGDGFGDNNKTGDYNGDMCPYDYALTTLEGALGCPDTDKDGVVDPLDGPNGLFKDDFYQQSDRDGDGWGDNQSVPNGDDCIDTYGTSNNNSRQGCPDQDGDTWADIDDAFDEDPLQWLDSDGDGCGDNHGWEPTTMFEESMQINVTIRQEWGDAFIDVQSQCHDADGDGYGDNKTGLNPDAFQFIVTQWQDADGDGFGDNFTVGAWQSDDCQTIFGTSYIDVFGCPDEDEDGVSDTNDPCPYDPSIKTGLVGDVTCLITKSDAELRDEANQQVENALDSTTLIIISASILLMLALILTAMVSKQMARKKTKKTMQEELYISNQLDDEEQRRLEWIDFYVKEGNLDKARELGWTGDEVVPQWKQYEMDQEAVQEAAIPGMLSLDDL